MADLTPIGSARWGAGSGPLRRRQAVVAVGVVLVILSLGLARIAAGWSPLAPDDARYMIVGLSVLDGQGSVTPNGGAYLLRSPVFGVAMAIGSRLLGGDPIDGARLVAVGAALLGLLGALRVGWLVGGSLGAAGTAIALAATPLVWQLLPSLRIDLPQTALIVLLLLAAWRPTVWRWAAAGVVLGLAVLVKETALPLLLLPVALVGSVPNRVALAMAAAYGGAALVVAGWWWVVVWMASGQVFPLNALAVIEARDVAGSLGLPWFAGILVGVAIPGWSLIAFRARHDLGPRLLLFAAVGLAPAAIYAASQGLDARNFVALTVLSSIAIGTGAAALVKALGRRGTGSRVGAQRPVLAGVALAVTLTTVAIGQSSVARPGSDRLADEIVAWVSEHVPDGGRIVMPFRDREVIALRRFGRTVVRSLTVRRVLAADDPTSYLWMGLREEQLFGYTRRNWEAALTEPPPAFLVMVGPHPFTPIELLDTDAPAPDVPGLRAIATLEVGSDRADILRVDPADVVAGTPGMPLRMSADAALAWLDLAAGADGDDDAVVRLLAARPVVSGAAIPTLLERLGARACAIPGPAGTMSLTPAPACPG